MPYRLYVFGSNGECQLGIPAEEIVSTPTLARSWSSDPGLKALRSGDNHTLLLTASGELWGAGDNRKAQLKLPRMTKLEKIVKLYSNIGFCAATCESSANITTIRIAEGTTQRMLTTQGAGPWGELGIGYFANSTDQGEKSYPELPGPYPVIDFAAGGWHYVAILADGSVYGWGKSRLDQLGPKLSPQQRVTTPTKIEEDIPFKPVKLVCGKEFTYLASGPSTGQHYLLGRDKFSLWSSMPPHIRDWKEIGATWHAIFVLFNDGSLTAWGKDNMWKLVPENLPPIEMMAVGSEHVLAVTKKEKLISWGWGKHGNCGDLKGREEKVKNDMVSGVWNDIEIPGKIEFVGAGFCTSFVLTEVPEQDGAAG